MSHTLSRMDIMLTFREKILHASVAIFDNRQSTFVIKCRKLTFLDQTQNMD